MVLNILKILKYFSQLESRRIDYEIDKLSGNNWVEKAIRDGLYR
jgi:hypothetical protein